MFFAYFFCVFLPPFLNIFCFCQVHSISVLYWAHLCMKCSLGISYFLHVISSLFHSVVFLYFFALITEWGFLISPCYSLELYIQMEYLSFSPLLFTLLFTAILRHPQTTILFFSISFSWGWCCLLSLVQCLPFDALFKHLPSYWDFSYLGCGASLQNCSSKAKLLLLIFDVGYLLSDTSPNLGCGVTPRSCH